VYGWPREMPLDHRGICGLLLLLPAERAFSSIAAAQFMQRERARLWPSHIPGAALLSLIVAHTRPQYTGVHGRQWRMTICVLFIKFSPVGSVSTRHHSTLTTPAMAKSGAFFLLALSLGAIAAQVSYHAL
jgi:hypothetical protein